MFTQSSSQALSTTLQGSSTFRCWVRSSFLRTTGTCWVDFMLNRIGTTRSTPPTFSLSLSLSLSLACTCSFEEQVGRTQVLSPCVTGLSHRATDDGKVHQDPYAIAPWERTFLHHECTPCVRHHPGLLVLLMFAYCLSTIGFVPPVFAVALQAATIHDETGLWWGSGKRWHACWTKTRR